MNTRKAISYLRNSVCSFVQPNRKTNPKILSYLITNQCNSHCITCNAWKKAELECFNTNELRSLLSDELFTDIQHIGISGGEPSTFDMLIDHIKVIVETLPKIETLSITSNCILSDFWIENLLPICKICNEHKVYFQFNISLDGIGNVHDKIRGTKNNFSNTLKVIQYVKDNSINFQLHTTINKYNVYNVNDIFQFAKDVEADIIFRLASRIFRLDNEDKINKVCLDKKELSFICDFLTSNDLLSYTKSPGRKLFYKSLVKQLLSDGRRVAPCYFKNQGVVIAADGELSYCSRFFKSFASKTDSNKTTKFFDSALFDECCNGICERCFHDQTGLWPLHLVLLQYAERYVLPIKKLWYVFSSLCRVSLIIKRNINPKSIHKVCIIGMYGGEHVGDAAILGGSILRAINRNPSIDYVNVFSFRKDRTECWVENLTELPSGVAVKVYGNENEFRKEIKHCDLLLWAGGPIMELPVVLSRNYTFVAEARFAGIPVEMEGVGYGPVNTLFGKCLINKIVASSNFLTVRSETDAEKMKKYKSLDISVSPQDPAFTYLSYLQGILPVERREAETIRRMLIDSKRKIIALNLRPIWKRYGKNDSFSFDAFIKEIALLINKSVDTTFIFFPMNADKYGFSDLDVAYEIRKKIEPDADFRIWEFEPSINGVVSLLRKVDLALCMRFHAVIFAQSQKVPVIGIDYNLSGKGKVSSLFNDDKDVIQMKDFNHKTCLEIITRKV